MTQKNLVLFSPLDIKSKEFYTDFISVEIIEKKVEKSYLPKTFFQTVTDVGKLTLFLILMFF